MSETLGAVQRDVIRKEIVFSFLGDDDHSNVSSDHWEVLEGDIDGVSGRVTSTIVDEDDGESSGWPSSFEMADSEASD